MIHKILLSVDTNSQEEAYAVIVQMIDWSQAFDRQCHKLGVQSFIDNGVRPSLIPILINFFQNRRMTVKWNGQRSSTRPLNGGGPQGGTLGTIEYTSQSNDNTDFLSDDEKFKYIDDLSVLEIINLIAKGLASYNCRFHVPSDIATENSFMTPENIHSQKYLDSISEWTDRKRMKLNNDKSKYMVINFTRNYQFNTRLECNGKMLNQVRETKLLGLTLSEDMTWVSNTRSITVKAYQRMCIFA